MLQPKKTRYRKMHRWVLKGKASRWATLAFGEFWLKATTHGFVNSRQIEAARKVIARTLKRWGKVWIRVFPHKPYTKKPLEVPMGWGKGWVEFYVAPTRPGHMLFEIAGVPRELAHEALRLAGDKLPVKTKVILPDEHSVTHNAA